MSVTWEDSTSTARLKAIAAAEESGEFDPDNLTWREYADLREALIMALLSTGFPPRSAWAITESNWQQVFKRLQILESTGGCYRIYNNGNKPSRSVFFTPEEVRSMIGLEVNAGNKSDTEFKNTIWRYVEEDAIRLMNNCINPPKKLQDDPYYYERLQMNCDR